MKRKILFLLFVILLTGCSATYDLEISDKSIDEVTSIIGNSNYVNNNLYKYYLEKPVPLSKEAPIQSESDEKLESVEYYDKEDLSNNGIVGLKFSGKFNNDIFIDDSYILSFFVGDYNIKKNNNEIEISVPTNFKAFKQFNDLENVTVNIKSKYKVKEHNADSVNGNVYTWNITRDNYNKEELKMILNKKGIFNSSVDKDNSMFVFTIVISILVAVLLVIYLLVKRVFLGRNSL